MPWNSTPSDLVADILNHLQDNPELTYSEVGELFGVRPNLVSDLARRYLSKEILTLRYSKVNQRAKMGNKNPMKGRTRISHHNAKEVVYTMGYLTEWAPEWWTGLSPKGNRCFVHQRVWCQANGVTAVPVGHVIHHKDENKLNNSLDNLECLTRRKHAQIHCVNNILKGATTIPGREVESSALEAQSLLQGG